jgi:uncharacterized protein (DUF2062 family)
MPRRTIKRLIPSTRRIRALNLHRFFGDRINNRKLWIINRISVSRAVAIGLFCAYLPLPFQMLLAALLAILFRANLPVAVVLVWISNPLTFLIIYTPPYLLGLLITGETAISLSNITIEMMMQQFAALWIGSLIFGTGLAIAGYILSNVVWRLMVTNRWTSRKKRERGHTEPEP